MSSILYLKGVHYDLLLRMIVLCIKNILAIFFFTSPNLIVCSNKDF